MRFMSSETEVNNDYQENANHHTDSQRPGKHSRTGGNLAGQLLSASVVFPVGWATAGLVVCCGIGITFGLYPAWKAVSLDPIEALRYE